MVRNRMRWLGYALALAGLAGCAEMGRPGAPWEEVALTAKQGQIAGTHAQLARSKDVDYVGWWDNTDTQVKWTVKDFKPGTYRVNAVYAFDQDFSGSTIEVSVDGSKVSKQLGSTKNWDDYHSVALGDVKIDKGGDTTVMLKATEKPRQYVANIKEITLTPDAK